MRATFKTVFYVNASKEKNGVVPHHGTSYHQRNHRAVQLQAEHPKDTLGCQGQLRQGQEQGGAGGGLRI